MWVFFFNERRQTKITHGSTDRCLHPTCMAVTQTAWLYLTTASARSIKIHITTTSRYCVFFLLFPQSLSACMTIHPSSSNINSEADVLPALCSLLTLSCKCRFPCLDRSIVLCTVAIRLPDNRGQSIFGQARSLPGKGLSCHGTIYHSGWVLSPVQNTPTNASSPKSVGCVS